MGHCGVLQCQAILGHRGEDDLAIPLQLLDGVPQRVTILGHCGEDDLLALIPLVNGNKHTPTLTYLPPKYTLRGAKATRPQTGAERENSHTVGERIAYFIKRGAKALATRASPWCDLEHTPEISEWMPPR